MVSGDLKSIPVGVHSDTDPSGLIEQSETVFTPGLVMYASLDGNKRHSCNHIVADACLQMVLDGYDTSIKMRLYTSKECV